MANHTCSIEIAPIEPSGFMLTIAELPRLVIFADTVDGALHHAQNAIAVYLRDVTDPGSQQALQLQVHERNDDRPQRDPFSAIVGVEAHAA